MKRIVVLQLLILVLAATTVLAQSVVPLKAWNEYSDTELESLRGRWSAESADTIMFCLKNNLPLPDYVGKLSPLNSSAMMMADDLRGLSLNGAELQKADLTYKILQGADLFVANLDGASLDFANLEGANLRRASMESAKMDHADLKFAILESGKLTNATLTNADLQGVTLSSANLEAADLTGSILDRATIIKADFKYAILHGATFRSATLRESIMQDADLYQAVFDSTFLFQVQLGNSHNIRDIIWGDSTASRYFIGEEISMKSSEDFRRAELTYRDLKTLYRRELLDEIAGEFLYRESEVETKSYPWYSPVRILRTLFLKWTFGYGSRPVWLIYYSMTVVLSFTLIFAGLTLSKRTLSGICLVTSKDYDTDDLLPFNNGLIFLECFYFSLLSLATFGYGALQPRQWLQFFRFKSVEYKPIRWACIFVGLEAGLGIWIFSLLVTVLFGAR